ncbi:Brain and acute leukemia cytoplasmic protein [Triplophysa tibetana]|uniref:Brain and acute leukemia cytoplasmic protein n=1 Tax=Triplophysa tibetana TaxID=1572043 RepID=A0A5A9NL86_9TELE|nr:Brain and acute leukemia cytoplasmic protein [Triplophysa tibetana]
MGCGGSRADAIEPRYHESWTRETESTWLTNTDAEIPNVVTYKSHAVRGERNHALKENVKLSGKGVEAKSVLSSCGARRMVNTGTQCGNQAVTKTKHQRTYCSHEPTCDSKQTTHKKQNSHSEGVSSVSNAASHPEEPSGKKQSSPDVECSH